MNRDPSSRNNGARLVAPLIAGSLLISGCEDVLVGDFDYRDGEATRQVFEAKDKPETSDPDDKEKGDLVRTEYYRCAQNENGQWKVVREDEPVDGPREEVKRYFAKACSDNGTLEFPEVP